MFLGHFIVVKDALFNYIKLQIYFAFQMVAVSWIILIKSLKGFFNVDLVNGKIWKIYKNTIFMTAEITNSLVY